MSGNAFKYAIIVAFGGFVFGLDAALISGTIDFVSNEFQLNDLQKGFVVSAPGWGVLIALLFAGYMADSIGRKRTLQIIAAFYLVSAVGSTLAPSFQTLAAFRFLGGLAFTSLSLSAMYIGEIAPANMRGKLVAMNQINIVIGLSAAYFINYLILQISKSDAVWVTDWGLNTQTWRWMLGSEILPVILWSILLLFIPKSPRWLVLKGRTDEARSVLSTIMSQSKIEAEILGIQKSLAEESIKVSYTDQLKNLFDSRLKKAVIIGVTFAIVQQIIGINAILFYAPTIFKQLGLGQDAAFIQAVWVGVISVIFTLLALLCIDRIGRRPMTLGGLLWASVSLAICAYGFSQASYILSADDVAAIQNLDGSKLTSIIGVEYESDVAFKSAIQTSLGSIDANLYEGDLLQKAGNLPGNLILFGIMSFIAAFQFSVGPIMWIVFSEVFPTRVRGIAIPACAMVTSIVSVLVQQLFPWQLTNMGAKEIFLFYAVMSVVGLIALTKFLPETKNKTIEEIELELA